jgi:hypothetical protein
LIDLVFNFRNSVASRLPMKQNDDHAFSQMLSVSP